MFAFTPIAVYLPVLLCFACYVNDMLRFVSFSYEIMCSNLDSPLTPFAEYIVHNSECIAPGQMEKANGIQLHLTSYCYSHLVSWTKHLLKFTHF